MALWQDTRSRASDKGDILGMARRASVRAADDSDSNWVFSFADMVTLLLSFFVILTSISNFDEERYALVQKNIAETLKVTPVATTYVRKMAPSHAHNIEIRKSKPQDLVKDESKKGAVLPEEVTSIDRVLFALETVIQSQGLDQQVSIKKFKSAATVSFPEGVFFASGAAEFSKDATPFLDKVAAALKAINEPVVLEVEGHTDNRPIIKNYKLYHTNWELSTSRATQVVRYFIKRGLPPEHLVAKGFADTHPLAPNLDTQGKPILENQKHNRRVVLKIVAVGPDGSEGVSK